MPRHGPGGFQGFLCDSPLLDQGSPSERDCFRVLRSSCYRSGTCIVCKASIDFTFRHSLHGGESLGTDLQIVARVATPALIVLSNSRYSGVDRSFALTWDQTRSTRKLRDPRVTVDRCMTQAHSCSRRRTRVQKGVGVRYCVEAEVEADIGEGADRGNSLLLRNLTLTESRGMGDGSCVSLGLHICRRLTVWHLSSHLGA